MALTPGTRLGVYEVTAQIGVGGMGEVYRARDSRLQRDVAIKVLPEAFAQDADRLTRFEREARTLAALNHPHIAHIYGLEDANGVKALVMELVEGEDLAQRIARAAMPLDEVLPIAKQIAEALEAAHEQGIIHRDLKPANIKLRSDGTVKVLDFGLAKAMDPPASSPNVSQSPTITTPAMTQVGMILGTAAYISPEQARGKPVDKRADIWAFGCVVYEMLTGRRAFAGEDVMDTLARVNQSEPDWTALRPDTPAALRACLTTCLKKNPRERFHHIGDVRLALDGAFAPLAAVAAQTSASPPTRDRRLRTLALITAGMFVGAGLTAALLWRPPQLDERPVTRLLMDAGRAQPAGGGGLEFTLSADGRTLVYAARENGIVRLYRRHFNEIAPSVLAGTEDARTPVLSPDGQWVAFFAGPALKKLALAGGAAMTIAPAEGNFRGAAWLLDNTILYGSSAGLWRVSSEGGKPALVTHVDRDKREAWHINPRLMPDNTTLLFGVNFGTNNGPTQLHVLSLATGEHRLVLDRVGRAYYVAPGYLVYSESDSLGLTTGTVWATRFDPAQLRPLGSPIKVLDALNVVDNAAQFVVDVRGTLVYQAGTPTRVSRLVWVDRKGREEPLNAPPRAYYSPRLSSDGSRVAVDIHDAEFDIWIWDLQRDALDRLTSGPGREWSPIFSHDGTHIVYTASDSRNRLLYRSADGSGPVKELVTTDFATPGRLLPDGTLVFTRHAVPTGFVPSLLRLTDPTRTVTPLLPSGSNLDVSPDGRWVVYQSSESGRNEVYTRPFPNVNDRRILVSTEGGTRPMWSHDGREIFYVAADLRSLMAVAVDTKSGQVQKPRLLFEHVVVDPQQRPMRAFDLSPDGQRFLMLAPAQQTEAGARGFEVVLNFADELKRLLPAGQ